mmetsp:Transcript_13155/g.18074  ORF Transcript_13155/g.18074 Transcript_13155/m.18074 type:complete len:434 (-) Transcript_13155:42-1343(-)
MNERIPLINEVPPDKRLPLFVKKIRLCCEIYDFTNPNAHVQEKLLKRQTLLELVHVLEINHQRILLIYELYSEIFRLIVYNIFRPFPPRIIDPELAATATEEDEEVYQEPAWSHLEHVYRIFILCLESEAFNAERAKPFLDRSFLVQFLQLFDSDDNQERDILKTILHRIYTRFIGYRSFIRAEITHLCWNYVYEKQQFAGIAQLLEVLTSIISGFFAPLKNEHKLLLTKTLLPLYKGSAYRTYRTQLTHCVLQFLAKDTALIEIVFKKIIRFWPLGDSSKELLLIEDISFFLAKMGSLDFDRIYEPLFKRLNVCLRSHNVLIIEAVFGVLQNNHIFSLILSKMEPILRILFEGVYRLATDNWHNHTKNLATVTLRTFKAASPATFRECLLSMHLDPDNHAWLQPKPPKVGSLGQQAITTHNNNNNDDSLLNL